MPEYAVLPAEPCVRLVTPAVHVFILFSEEYFVYNPMDVVRGHFHFSFIRCNAYMVIKVVRNEVKPTKAA